MEGHNRMISGPNYVTWWSFISRTGNTFVLSLYKLPLHLGWDVVWNISSSHLIPARTVLPDRHPIREAAPRWSNFGTMFWCQGEFPKEDSKLPCSLCSAFFLLYITSNSPTKRRFVDLSHTIKWTPACEQRREKERASGGFLN